MPRGDRTGPDGRGPMTGRGAGYCSGSTTPGYSGRFFNLWNLGRRIFNNRLFRGRGMRNTVKGNSRNQDPR